MSNKPFNSCQAVVVNITDFNRNSYSVKNALYVEIFNNTTPEFGGSDGTIYYSTGAGKVPLPVLVTRQTHRFIGSDRAPLNFDLSFDFSALDRELETPDILIIITQLACKSNN